MADLGLGAFVAYQMERQWQPGSVDCLLALADWAIWRGYPDPAAHLRGAYDSEDGFRAIIERAGGVVPLVQSCADRIGLLRASDPEIGFVGVIGSRTNIHRQFGAIYSGGGLWSVRFKDAYPAIRAHPMAIWKL